MFIWIFSWDLQISDAGNCGNVSKQFHIKLIHALGPQCRLAFLQSIHSSAHWKVLQEPGLQHLLHISFQFFFGGAECLAINWDTCWWNKYSAVPRYYQRQKMAAWGWIYCGGGWSTMGRLLGRMDGGSESPGHKGEKYKKHEQLRNWGTTLYFRFMTAAMLETWK